MTSLERSSRTKPYSVHGRFQPFHNGHLNYVRAALDLTDFVHVGITKLDRSAAVASAAAPHRSNPASNPFSFYERKSMIEETLVDEGIPAARFTVIPFLHDDSELLPECFPTSGVCFTTVHTEWNNVKIDRLRSLGYDVRVLDSPDRWPAPRASASTIRERLRARDSAWMNFVPRKIAEIINESYLQRFL